MKIKKNNKTIIYGLLFLCLIFLFSINFISSYTNVVSTADYARLSTGDDYRIEKYTKRVDYTGTYDDLFLPLKTQAEWDAFVSNPPSGITITDYTCEMTGTTNWDPSGIYGCSGSNKRCYGGVCRIFSNALSKLFFNVKSVILL